MKPGVPKPAFELDVVNIRVEHLLPTRPPIPGLKVTQTFRKLFASVREVGIVEPINVYPEKKGGKYLILDGHVRVEALRELGMEEAPCLISLTPEIFTYNEYVCRIAPIQAIRMILRAIDAGVSEERIARTLNLSVDTVRENRNLLKDIAPEAVELLRDKQVSHAVLNLLKKVKPIRQIEIAEMLVSAATYTMSYARVLMVGTSKDQLVDPEKGNRIPGVKPEDLARLEHEMQVQERDFKLIDESYNEQVMELTIARGYLRTLLANGRVTKFLKQHFAEFLTEFERLSESTTLEA